MAYKNTLNILCSCDNNYSQHCGVMLCSLLENCSIPKKVKIFLLDGGINKENKEKIKKMVQKYGSKIYFKKIEDKRLSYFDSFKGRGNLCNYFRLFLDNLDIDYSSQIIYLDADMIVKGDVKELQKYFNKNIVVYAVSEGIKLHKKNHSSLGLSKKDEYFNSGLLVINTEQWKKKEILKRIISFYQKRKHLFEFNDQDPLNGVLKNDWKKLPLEWNTFPLIYSKGTYKEFLNIDKEKIKKLRNNPKIIHYCGYHPWKFKKYHPKEKEYWRYLEKTPWKDYRYPDKNLISLFKRTYSFLNFHVPYKIRKIFKWIK